MKKIIPIILLTFIPLISVSQNHSLNFDGLDDYVDLENNLNFDNTDQFSIEAWVKTNKGTNLQQVISKLDGNFKGWGLQINNGVLSGYLFAAYLSNQRYVEGSTNIADGIWHHVVMTFDGEEIILYVDGNMEVLSDSNNIGEELQSTLNNGETHIGNYDAEGSPGEHFKGNIDELRIWNNVRTVEEIQLNYNSEISGTEENLIGYYKMDSINTDCDVVDCSSNGTHGQRANSEGIDDIPQFSTDVAEITDVACGAATGCTLSTNTVANALQFNVFPNPTNDILTISGIDTTDSLTITVLNLLGDTVKAYKSKNPKVDLSNFSSGVYLLTVEANGLKTTKKIVKL